MILGLVHKDYIVTSLNYMALLCHPQQLIAQKGKTTAVLLLRLSPSETLVADSEIFYERVNLEGRNIKIGGELP